MTQLCHGIEHLTPRGRSNRIDREEYLFECSCGQKWQWTQQAGYYQVKARTDNAKVVMTKRVTPEQADNIRAGRGKLVYKHNPGRHE